MDALERYIRGHSAPQGEVLDWLEKESWLRTSHGRMIAGPEVGAFLRFLVMTLRPDRVLELGTFTGYSTIWMASALPEGGRIDSIEINDELEDLTREGFRRAGCTEKVRLILGDALDILPRLGESYGLIYIDANKRDYPAYYQAAFNLLGEGGCIVADNVLWDGKVLAGGIPSDRQTNGILAFNEMVTADERVENFILPLRDGLNIIRKK